MVLASSFSRGQGEELPGHGARLRSQACGDAATTVPQPRCRNHGARPVGRYWVVP
jgi:hypothetical protein